MAKRSRRTRRQQIEKQKRRIPDTTAAKVIPDDVVAPDTPVSPETVGRGPVTSRKMVNFAQEYFYVYQELRNIFIIAVVMFAVLVGLSFVI
jgi:hypothetical protein